MKIKHLTLTLLLFSANLFANIQLTDNTTVIFADVEQGKTLLGKKDDFVSRLSPFDRASRMKTDRDVSTAKYLEFVKSHVKPWTDADKTKLTTAFAVVSTALAEYDLPFPNQVVMIKTSGQEEASAAYTRGNAIMFGNAQLEYTPDRLQYLLYHELFHVLSRTDKRLKNRLYQSIGFYQTRDLQFPKSLLSKKLTNPDAPINDHYIQLIHQDKLIKAVPILFSKSERYDMEKGGEFFNYLQFKLLVVDHNLQTGTLKPALNNGELTLLGVKEVPDFMAQIGQNTGYIIHPEEILADNFAFLLGQRKEIKSPQILANIKTILEH